MRDSNARPSESEVAEFWLNIAYLQGILEKLTANLTATTQNNQKERRMSVVSSSLIGAYKSSS